MVCSHFLLTYCVNRNSIRGLNFGYICPDVKNSTLWNCTVACMFWVLWHSVFRKWWPMNDICQICSLFSNSGLSKHCAILYSPKWWKPLPYIWKLFHQNSNLHLDGRSVLQENDVSQVSEDTVQPRGSWLLKEEILCKISNYKRL